MGEGQYRSQGAQEDPRGRLGEGRERKKQMDERVRLQKTLVVANPSHLSRKRAPFQVNTVNQKQLHSKVQRTGLKINPSA